MRFAPAFVSLLLFALLSGAPVGADEDAARDDARADLVRLVRRVDRLVGDPEPDDDAAEALAAWNAAREEALALVLDEEKFARGPGDEWESPESARMLAVTGRAAKAFAVLQKKLVKTLDRALRLKPKDAVERTKDLRAARERFEKLEAARPEAERERIPPPSDLDLAVLAAAARDFADAATRTAALGEGWPGLVARFAYAVSILTANAERAKELGRRTPSLDAMNRYRMSLGRQPVFLNGKLCRAAAGHSRSMRELGFFDHDSPVEGRKTETDRAKAEGYGASVSEIIYATPDLRKALLAWKLSPRHHRAMISTAWTEAGASTDGPITVDFGGGEDGSPPKVGLSR